MLYFFYINSSQTLRKIICVRAYVVLGYDVSRIVLRKERKEKGMRVDRNLSISMSSIIQPSHCCTRRWVRLESILKPASPKSPPVAEWISGRQYPHPPPKLTVTQLGVVFYWKEWRRTSQRYWPDAEDGWRCLEACWSACCASPWCWDQRKIPHSSEAPDIPYTWQTHHRVGYLVSETHYQQNVLYFV